MTSGTVSFPPEASLPQAGGRSAPSLDCRSQAAGSAGAFPRGCLWEERGVLCVAVTGLGFKPQAASLLPSDGSRAACGPPSSVSPEPPSLTVRMRGGAEPRAWHPSDHGRSGCLALLSLPAFGASPGTPEIWGCLPLLNPILLPDNCLKSLRALHKPQRDRRFSATRSLH